MSERTKNNETKLFNNILNKKETLLYSVFDEPKRDPLKDKACDDFYDEAKNIRHNLIKVKKVTKNEMVEWRISDKRGMMILYWSDFPQMVAEKLLTVEGMQAIVQNYKKCKDEKSLISALTKNMSIR